LSPELDKKLAQAAAEGLNFHTAVHAHQDWKTRLQSCVEGRSEEKIPPSVIAQDDKCALGTWLHANKTTIKHPLFEKLLGVHAQFHIAASKVAEECQCGNHEEAIKLMRHGEYTKASRNVVNTLGELQLMVAFN
jgi:hypothetical protein